MTQKTLQARLATTLALVTAVVALLLGATLAPSSAAFIAGVTNTTNTMRLGIFTCRAAGSTARITYSLREGDADSTYYPRNLGTGGTNYNGRIMGWADYFTNPETSCPRDDDGYLYFNGNRHVRTNSNLAITGATSTISQAVWVRAGVAQGLIFGIGDQQTNNSTNKGQAAYFNAQGQITYFTWAAVGNDNALTSPLSYADGEWHHIVTTYSQGLKRLYVDGVLVGSSTHVSQNLTGYWRIGKDNLSGYPNTAHVTNGVVGDMRWASFFNTALTATEVQALYMAGV